jgi:hypothetical protein
MNGTAHLGGRFRVWIARYVDWLPGSGDEVPPAAVAVEPAEQGTMSGEEAATYVEAFNAAALDRPGNLWAVALPVEVRYEGEPRPGQEIEIPRPRSWPGDQLPATRFLPSAIGHQPSRPKMDHQQRHAED